VFLDSRFAALRQAQQRPRPRVNKLAELMDEAEGEVLAI
jgi:hypothetical protein